MRVAWVGDARVIDAVPFRGAIGGRVRAGSTGVAADQIKPALPTGTVRAACFSTLPVPHTQVGHGNSAASTLAGPAASVGTAVVPSACRSALALPLCVADLRQGASAAGDVADRVQAAFEAGAVLHAFAQELRVAGGRRGAFPAGRPADRVNPALLGPADRDAGAGAVSLACLWVRALPAGSAADRVVSAFEAIAGGNALAGA